MNVSEAIMNLRTDLEHMIGFLSRVQQTCVSAHATLSREFGIAQGTLTADSEADAAADWEIFLSELRDAFGSEWFTVGQLAEDDRYFTLPDSLAAVYERNRERGLTRAIGKAFRKRVGKRYGAHQLHLAHRFEKHAKQAEWKIATTATKATPVPLPAALIDTFIREHCEVSPEAYIRSSEFNAAYTKWHQANSTDPRPTRNEIALAMRLRGYMQNRSRRIHGIQARTIEGLRIRRRAAAADQKKHRKN